MQSIKSSTKIVSHKEIISWFLPEIDLSCLRLGDSKESKLNEALLDFDEQNVS